MKLIFGSDHAGYVLKRELSRWAMAQGYSIQEVGADSEEPYDYPDASALVAAAVLKKEAYLGVLMCGTGTGVCIAANRYKGIRAANCCTAQMARLAREHNYANVLCLGGRILDKDQAIEVLDSFLKGQPDLHLRHQRRVEKLDQINERIKV